MKFKVNQKIFEKWPEVKIGVVVLLGINNGKKNPEILNLIRAEEEKGKKELEGKDFNLMPEVAIWKEVYKDFGSNPREYRSSVEALLRRVRSGSQIPQINNLVDLYNYFSIKFHVPAGAEDLDKVKGDIFLTFADGTETGKYIGSVEEDTCYKDEIIYKDDAGFICRRWNWREGDRTKIEDNTQNAVLVFEAMPPVTEEQLKKVTDESCQLIKKYLGGEQKICVLSKSNPIIEIDFVTGTKAAAEKITTQKAGKEHTGVNVIPLTHAGGVKAIVQKELPPKEFVSYEIIQSIYNAIKKCYPQVDVKAEDIQLEHPVEEAHGDYACNISMLLSKQLKANPLEIAQRVVNFFYSSNEVLHQTVLDEVRSSTNSSRPAQQGSNNKLPVFLEKIDIAGPGFINFWLSKKYLTNHLSKIQNEGINFGKNSTGSNKKVALEHTNVNPNKALHIGHLRNACIGQAIERLWEASGYNVEVQYYVDDTGDQVAGTVLALRTLKIEPQEGIKFDHFSWDMYAKISEMFQTDEEIVQKKQEILRAVEEGNNEIATFTKNVATKIIADNLATCHWYGFDYDVLIWEGDILRRGLWEESFKILKKSKAFVLDTEGKNKGCWVIKDKATGGELGGDKVIVRSNGTVIYAGKDIAYHMWKFNLLNIDFKYKLFPNAPQKKPLWTTTNDTGGENPGIGKVDIVLNVIDVRQTFTLGSVKVALKALGYPEQSNNMHHIGYGVVYMSKGSMVKMGFATEEGKNIYAMAGRAGIGIMADTLLDKVKLEVEKRFPDSAFQSQLIAVAAIKYGMLTYNTFSDIIFDLDASLALTGNTGVYLQYTYARAKSVINKESRTPYTVNSIRHAVYGLRLENEELAILRTLYKFPEVVLMAAKNYAPNLVCNYLFDLAQKFNTFYDKLPILKAPQEQKEFRLQLTAATAQVIKNGLHLLGIEAPERM